MLEDDDAQFRQGDHLAEVQQIFIAGPSGELSLDTPLGAVLLTQCCDLARGANSGCVNLAMLVELEPDKAKEATSGRTSRYVALRHLGESMFADLGSIGSASFEMLESIPVASRFPSETLRKAFAARIARRFGRFPYPDELHPLLKPLRDLVREKIKKEASPVGIVFLSRIETLLIEMVGGWDSKPPWNLMLLVVVKSEFLPVSDLDSIDPGDGKATASPRPIHEVAKEILATAPSESAQLWVELGEALSEVMLSKAGLPPEVLSDLFVDVMNDEELTYGRFHRSATVDLDDLSDTL
jgi:hypothetical protein